jgi:phage tail-like protein
VLLMDVNGSRFHLVLGHDDWEDTIVPPIDPDVMAPWCYDGRRNALGLRPRPFVFPTRPEAVRLTTDDRRGAAVDRFGNHFWVGPDRHTILVLGAGRTEAFEWWPAAETDPEPRPAPGAFEECAATLPTGLVLSCLAITEDHYLVAGVLDLRAEGGASAGLLVFDLADGGPPLALVWPRALGVRPLDLTARPGGGVVVLDVPDPPGARSARLWHLDRWFRVVDLGNTPVRRPEPPLFAPAAPPTEPDCSSIATGTSAVSEATATNAATLDVAQPVAVDALADGTVLVLDRRGADGHLDVSRWRCGVRLPFWLRLDEPPEPDAAFGCTEQRGNATEVLEGVVGHDFAGVPLTDGSGLARLFVVDERGDQAFEFVVNEDGAELVTAYHPLRLFSGKALVNDGETVFYDLDARWYPVPTQPVDRFATDGQVVLAPDLTTGRGFDAGAPGTVWHRFVADATIPPGTSLTVETRAADDLSVLDMQRWLPEPELYLRGDGSEVPYHSYGCGDPAVRQGSWELLFQRSVGRYLQVRLTLHGDGRRTPRLWAVRLHYPRFSYLQEYLPDIYREDRESASFLDRYLSNVEGMYTTLEGRIANAQRLVDPQTIDAAYLPWLAEWVGGVVEPDWEAARKRLFVRHAAQMFTRRGTPRGLLEASRLATHPSPTEAIFDTSAGSDPFGVRVVERFRTRAVSGMVFGDPNDVVGPRYTTEGPRWVLGDGGEQLDARWQAFLTARGAAATVGFPVLTPTDPTDAAGWSDFVRSELEFPYARVGSADDLAEWRGFLAQRYRRIGAYRMAWNMTGSSGPADFESVAFPTAVPADGAPLQDWVRFVSTVLPTKRAAHRATVLVPIRFDDSDETRAQRVGRVRRVVDVERPAHTLVDVQPYWAAFRVGEARVGFETIVGDGGRYVDIVLGAGRLARSVTPGGGAWRVAGRLVLGRDRVGRSVEPAKSGGS